MAMTPFTPIFNRYKTVAHRLGLLQDLQKLSADAKTASLEELTPRVSQFLAKLAHQAQSKNSPAIWDSVKELLVLPVEQNPDADKALKKQVLDKIARASNEERLAMLRQREVAQYFAGQLKGVYGASERLTREEHIEHVGRQAHNSMKEDWFAIASQANYEPWKRVGKMLYKLLLTIVQLCAQPELRSTADAQREEAKSKEGQASRIQFLPPMK